MSVVGSSSVFYVGPLCVSSEGFRVRTKYSSIRGCSPKEQFSNHRILRRTSLLMTELVQLIDQRRPFVLKKGNNHIYYQIIVNLYATRYLDYSSSNPSLLYPFYFCLNNGPFLLTPVNHVPVDRTCYTMKVCCS